MSDWASAPNASQPGGASVLDRDVTINGTISSRGSVRIDGVVEGDVQVRTLTLSRNAVIRGGVQAQTAMIEGEIDGTLEADDVRLAASARVKGDIIHSVLRVESGAQFDGGSRRKPKAAAPAAPAAE